MRKSYATWILASAMLISVPVAGAQEKTPPDQLDSALNPDNQKNLQEYIALLSSDVQQRKAEVLGAVMDLNAADAAKFWPIYAEYNAELNQLNAQRAADIQEYARTYDQMTDVKADELIRRALEYRKHRPELLEKYYERVKLALGATTAARFVQVEDQLLSIVDLQIDSSLPVVGKSS